MKFADFTSRRIVYLASAVVGGGILAICLAWTKGPAHDSAADDPPADPHTAVVAHAASPKTAGALPLLPSEFAILQSRNVFGNSIGGADGVAGANGGPESTLVFRGAVAAGDVFTAFIEDTVAKHSIQATVGTPLGRGKIKSIDIDAIEYEFDGQSKRIEVGDDLTGKAAPIVPTTQPTPPSPPAAGPDQAGPPQPPNGRPRRGGNPVVITPN